MMDVAEHTVKPPAKPGSARLGRFRQTKRLVASWSRWLHIYTSMFGLAVALFFAATGITLNHPDWFGETEVSRATEGQLELSWVRYQKPVSTKDEDDPQPVDDLAGVARLEVVEFLRNNHHLRGSLGQFSGDDRELMVTLRAQAIRRMS